MICGEDSSKTHFDRMAPTPCPHPELYKNPRLLPPAAAAPAQAEWREYFAGWGSGIVNICVTFPVNKTMFRQQLHGISALSAFKQLRSEGLLNLYRGILPPLLQKSASTALMFGSYEQYRRLLLEQGINSNTSLVAAAFLAGCTEALLTPFERIQTLMLDQKYSGQFRNTPHAFHSVYSSLGFREYYRGLTAILMRNGPSNIIFFSFRDNLRDSLPESMDRLGLLADFISGACLGAFISTVFYPVNTTKTHMQKTLGGEFQNFRSVFRLLLKERGAWGMFRGVHVNYTRSFMSWGIINMSYSWLLGLLAS